MLELLGGLLIGFIFALGCGFFLWKTISKAQDTKFNLLAKQLADQNSQKLTQTAKENLASVVTPLGEKVQEYKQYLDQIHKYDLKDRESLRERMNHMMDSAHKMEVEARNLQNVLTQDVKFQGNWGEVVLERILELAGLESGREFFTQEVLKDEEGKDYRPDVLVKLPNESHIVIDSKVSLKAYYKYTSQEGDREIALKEIKTSINTHIETLAKKKYQNLQGVNSPDFVYLFIPVEGVFSLVAKEFPELLDKAITKNVIIVSPLNLSANLKTVASLWRLEKQSKNAQEMAQKAGAMYDKFSAVVTDLGKLEQSIVKSQTLHHDIMKKISEGRGNLISRAEELRELGAKTSKTIEAKHLN